MIMIKGVKQRPKINIKNLEYRITKIEYILMK